VLLTAAFDILCGGVWFLPLSCIPGRLDYVYQVIFSWGLPSIYVLNSMILHYLNAEVDYDSNGSESCGFGYVQCMYLLTTYEYTFPHMLQTGTHTISNSHTLSPWHLAESVPLFLHLRRNPKTGDSKTPPNALSARSLILSHTVPMLIGCTLLRLPVRRSD
jgi:hypothetical protein